MEADKETGTRNVSFIKAKCKVKKWKATNICKINEFSIKSIFSELQKLFENNYSKMEMAMNTRKKKT